MKKEVLIYLEDDYADWEIAYISPQIQRKDNDYIVKTFSLEKKEIISQGGLNLIVDYTLKDLPDDYAMVILVGGMVYAQNNFKIPLLREFIAKTIDNNIPVGAICDASTFLGRNGFLNNISHTGNVLYAMKEEPTLYTGDKYFVESQSVSSDNIVSANGTASLEFAYNIMKLLKLDSEEHIEEWYSFFKEGAYKFK
ncbi:MAG: DJ-1/PfpI family protein [Erysipelotrichales bacterium]